MGFCVGVAIALQLISAYPKPEIAFATPPVDIQVAKDCDHLPVSRNSRIINQRWKTPPDITICPSYNEILVDIPSQDFKFGDHLGTTRIWWKTETGEILKSKIEIVTGWENSERIIEHEIGHALGFKDNNIVGHLMNKVWTKGGYNRRGLENNDI